jgi:hypothetical protein
MLTWVFRKKLSEKPNLSFLPPFPPATSRLYGMIPPARTEGKNISLDRISPELLERPFTKNRSGPTA